MQTIKIQSTAYTQQEAIALVKQEFSTRLAKKLQLIKVEAPLMVEKGTGINDDLNGIEAPVSVHIKDMPSKQVEIVHSLAKWKRHRLGVLGAAVGKGLYTDMRALRPDEDLSQIHSVYVDQWDWEKVMDKKDRTITYLKQTVETIYDAIKEVEQLLLAEYGYLPVLPESITFLHTEDLAAQYPDLTPKERENEVTKQYGAVFLIGIGGELMDGKPHDGRAPDYDDWSTPTQQGYKGLNGDILLWNPVLERSFEVSSMGIRVDEAALLRQLEISQQEKRKDLFWHQELLKGALPQTIGGGIGQSRLAMFLLKKQHIGEVQCSVWSEPVYQKALEQGIELL